jgi:hypothetical protein
MDSMVLLYGENEPEEKNSMLQTQQLGSTFLIVERWV